MVDDIDAAAGFYARLLGEPGRRTGEDRHEFGGDDGGATLCCEARGPAAAARPPGPGAPRLSFRVGDIAGAFARARTAGCTMIDPCPRRGPGGSGTFEATDPWGHGLTFIAAGSFEPVR